jgi:hypothetical protein
MVSDSIGVDVLWRAGTGSIAATILAGGIWWLWWRFPQRHVAKLALKIRDPKARADVEDNLRKTIGQALGGIAVLIGAGVAYLQFLQQQQAARDLLISNQVSKGFEQLASHEIIMRLGGIYALQEVMNTSVDYHQPVLAALCAFVREGTAGMIIEGEPAKDIQAALTVISTRKPGAGTVDLRSSRIPRSDLVNAKLSHAYLSGADLTHAYLPGAVLFGAFLDSAKLPNAQLYSANLTSAYLSHANLSGANMSGADLTDAELTDIDLSDAIDLTQEQLNKACGKPRVLPAGLTLHNRCPEKPVARPLNPR